MAGAVRRESANAPAQALDHGQWKNNVLDLHRVRDIMNSLYLMLEHHNEALLRVGVELVTDRSARRSLWWTDGWWADEDRRKQFRAMVKDKLEKVFGLLGSRPSDDYDDGPAEGAAEAKPAAEKGSDMSPDQIEKEVKAAQEKQWLAERRARDLEDREEAMNSKMQSLQNTVAQLKAQLKEARGNGEDEAKRHEEERRQREEQERKAAQELAMKEQLERNQRASIMQELKDDFEKEKNELLEKLKGQESQAKTKDDKIAALQEELRKRTIEAQKSNADLEKEKKKRDSVVPAKGGGANPELEKKYTENMRLLKDAEEKNATMQARVDEAEKAALVKEKEAEESLRRLGEAEAAAEALRRELAEQQANPKIDPEKMKELKTEYEAKLKKLEDELQAVLKSGVDGEALQASRAEATELRRGLKQEAARRQELEALLEEAARRARDAEEAAEAARRAAGDTPTSKETVFKMSKDDKKEMEDLRARVQELEELVEKLRAMLKKSRQDVQDLTDEKTALEKQRMRMLKTLHDLKEQMEKLKAVAQKKGCGDVFNELMEESDVLKTLQSEEYTCFSRLYDDALRRQEKHRGMEQRVGVGRGSVAGDALRRSVVAMGASGRLMNFGAGGLPDDDFDERRRTPEVPFQRAKRKSIDGRRGSAAAPMGGFAGDYAGGGGHYRDGRLYRGSTVGRGDFGSSDEEDMYYNAYRDDDFAMRRNQRRMEYESDMPAFQRDNAGAEAREAGDALLGRLAANSPGSRERAAAQDNPEMIRTRSPAPRKVASEKQISFSPFGTPDERGFGGMMNLKIKGQTMRPDSSGITGRPDMLFRPKTNPQMPSKPAIPFGLNPDFGDAKLPQLHNDPFARSGQAWRGRGLSPMAQTDGMMRQRQDLSPASMGAQALGVLPRSGMKGTVLRSARQNSRDRDIFAQSRSVPSLRHAATEFTLAFPEKGRKAGSPRLLIQKGPSWAATARSEEALPFVGAGR